MIKEALERRRWIGGYESGQRFEAFLSIDRTEHLASTCRHRHHRTSMQLEERGDRLGAQQRLVGGYEYDGAAGSGAKRGE